MPDRVAPSKGADAEVKTQKWTKGEWKACHDADGDYVIFAGDGVNHKIIAITDLDRPEDEANAGLIAASPVMFDALNRMLCHFVGTEDLCIECGEQTGTGTTCDTCYVIAEAMSAIEKALGE